jgi:hypothetical protein
MHAFSCTAAHTVNGHERGSLNRSAPVSYATTLFIEPFDSPLKDRGRAQRAVDTSRWLYNKIETKPERERLREFGGLPHCPGIVLASYAASLNTYSELHKHWRAIPGLVLESNEEIPHSHVDGVSLLTVQLGTVPAWVAAAGIPFGLSVPPPKDGDRDGRSFRSRPVAVASDGG